MRGFLFKSDDRNPMPETTIHDVIVLGGGPAGLMAGISAAETGARVLVLEGESRPGKKLLITGGGHCNITNREVSEKDFRSGEPRAVRNILRAFPVRAATGFFREIGMDLVTDKDGKMFPRTRRAGTVLEALLARAKDLGVVLETGMTVLCVETGGGSFAVSGRDFIRRARAVVVATGGLSYPETGSRGAGYAIAKALGHRIVPTMPALVPLETKDRDWRSLAGITFEVRLALKVAGTVRFASAGPLLITHQGFSGPAIMDLSASWAHLPEKQDAVVVADLIPGTGDKELRDAFARYMTEHPASSLRKFLARYFPERLSVLLLERAGLDPARQMAHCSRREREILIRSVRAVSLPIDRSCGYDKAEVTAGGVAMADVEPRTLESRKVPGLFFAGEVLDVDGRIGGFNLHWAWASGQVAGMEAAKASKRPGMPGPALSIVESQVPRTRSRN
jgi:hypothetical protein